jgi:hypothetical protein
MSQQYQPPRYLLFSIEIFCASASLSSKQLEKLNIENTMRAKWKCQICESWDLLPQICSRRRHGMKWTKLCRFVVWILIFTTLLGTISVPRCLWFFFFALLSSWENQREFRFAEAWQNLIAVKVCFEVVEHVYALSWQFPVSTWCVHSTRVWVLQIFRTLFIQRSHYLTVALLQHQLMTYT